MNGGIAGEHSDRQILTRHPSPILLSISCGNVLSVPVASRRASPWLVVLSSRPWFSRLFEGIYYGENRVPQCCQI